MDERPGELGGVERRDESPREGAHQVGESRAAGGRRGGQKADRTFEKDETTRARGRGKTAEPKDADKASRGGRRAKKTESTAAEQESE